MNPLPPPLSATCGFFFFCLLLSSIPLYQNEFEEKFALPQLFPHGVSTPIHTLRCSFRVSIPILYSSHTHFPPSRYFFVSFTHTLLYEPSLPSSPSPSPSPSPSLSPSPTLHHPIPSSSLFFPLLCTLPFPFPTLFSYLSPTLPPRSSHSLHYLAHPCVSPFSYHLSFTSVPTHSCYLLLLFHFQISLLLLHFFSDDYNGIERLFFCFFILYFSFVSMYMFVLVFCGEMAFDTFVCISRIHYIFQRGFVKKDTSRGC